MVIKTLGCLSLLVLIAGCSGPLWQFPGGSLQGEEQPLTGAALPAECGVIQLETRPEDPYSVNIGCKILGGTIYVDPAESRTWYQNMKADPLVRLRFANSPVVFTAQAEQETDPEVLSLYDADRLVMRLVPRS